MNREEHLLTCLAEECAEVAQRVSKALRFGLDEAQPGQAQTNRHRIVDELGDLLSVAIILADEGIIPRFPMDDAMVSNKLSKIERFMVISREQGVLTGTDHG
jgi:NTP pyrophosphatase (non-canonical NTP hydrolase)